MIWLNNLLEQAQGLNATDIHLTAGACVRVRTSSGDMYPIHSEDKVAPDQIAQVVKTFLTPDEQSKLDRDRKLLVSKHHPAVGRLKCAVSFQRSSYYVTLKLHGNPADLDALSFPEAIPQLANLKGGLILLTGHPRSGKSTTAMRILQTINQEQTKSIVTIEHNIDVLLKHDQSMVKQKEVGLDAGSQLSALEFIQGEDADVIYIDEIHGQESLLLALQLAEQGKLVVAGTYTKNVIQTLKFLMAMYSDQHAGYGKMQVAAALKAIVSHKRIPGEGGLRQPLYEIWLNNKAMQRLIEEEKVDHVYDLMDQYTAMGMMCFDYSLAQYIAREAIDPDQGLQMAQSTSKVETILERGLAR